MSSPAPVSHGEVHTPLGDAPVIPLLIMMIGGYLAWFGIHYWRDQVTVWPSDPAKDVLQGKGVPAPSRSASFVSIIAQGGAEAAQESAGATPGSIGTGSDLSANLQSYAGKVKYVWGGANPATGWDCSGAVNYCACHNLRLDIPGIKGGQFTGKTHGPTTVEWITWTGCKTISRSEIQAGDLCVWQSHIGVAISNSEYVSAVDPAEGTKVGPIDGGGPSGETLVPRRIKQAVANESSTGAQSGSPDVEKNKNTARLLCQPFGWSSGTEWDDLENLWEQESGWNELAENPSGAYGIPQALPGSKMASAGPDWKTDAATQIRWGLGYIAGRYGSPSAAWKHEQANGWY